MPIKLFGSEGSCSNIKSHDEWGGCYDKNRENGLERCQPPITRVCCAIRAESLPHYYKVNDFYARVDSMSTAQLEKWLITIGKTSREALGRIWLPIQEDLRLEQETVDVGDSKMRIRVYSVRESWEIIRWVACCYQSEKYGVLCVEIEAV